jgi:hypothetical protein
MLKKTLLILALSAAAAAQNQIDFSKQIKNFSGYVSIPFESPALTDSGVNQFEFPHKMSFVRIYCSTDQGTLSINFEIRSEASPDSPGTPILASALVCNSTGVSTTTFAVAAVSADTPVALVISAVSGAPNKARAFLKSQISQ